MKSVLSLFARDVKRILKNPVALVIVIGICVIPSLYAWYSIAANWDPYGNTAGIKVAVVNEDLGHEDPSLGDVEIGSQVVDQLEGNDELGWVFTDRDDAQEGVASGRYYAAIVMPPSFSEDFTSVLSSEQKRPVLEYYVNEKRSAVAPKVTDTGAETLERQIDQSFVQAVSSATVTIVQEAGKAIENKASTSDSRLAEKTSRTIDEIASAQRMLSGSKEDVARCKEASESARQTVATLKDELPEITQALNEAQSSLIALRTDAGAFASGVNVAGTEALGTIGSATAKADAAISKAASSVQSTQAKVDAALEQAQGIADFNSSLVESLGTLAQGHPELEEAISKLEEKASQSQQALADLKKASQDISATASAVDAASQAMGDSVAQSTAIMTEAQRQFAASAMPQFSSGLDGLAMSCGALSGSLAALEPTLDQSESLLDELDSVLAQTEDTVSKAEEDLESLKTRLADTTTDLIALSDSLSLEAVSRALGLDANSVGEFMSSPVELSSETVYPVGTYGSGVAPFYTNLAIWVGGFVLIAILKLEADKEGFSRLTPAQAYLGRWLLFVVLGLVQALIVCAGDLAIGVQCLEPGLFVLAGLFTSFVYVNVIFALAITFKHIGKAIAVVLLIMQIPGSSGMYPIEMMPAFFQAIHPFLPFTYGIDAMRETIGGMYGWNYVSALAHLALFVPASLLVGLAIRPYLLNLNLLFDRKLAQTDLMVCEGPESASVERYRLRTVVRALLDNESYRARLKARTESFERAYPRLVKAGMAVLLTVPLLMLVAISVANPDVETKILLLALFVALVVLIVSYFIVLEYVHENLDFQNRLTDMDADELKDTARAHIPALESQKGGHR